MGCYIPCKEFNITLLFSLSVGCYTRDGCDIIIHSQCLGCSEELDENFLFFACTPGGTRTHNLMIRSQVPRPLGHKCLVVTMEGIWCYAIILPWVGSYARD
mgnify:CR=1 FL=1